jgi:hypothetical protein
LIALIFHFLKGNGHVEECPGISSCTLASSDEHFTSREAAQWTYDELIDSGVLKKPFYEVGDLIVLSGEGWDTYCSRELRGAKKIVTSVTPKGEAEFELVPSGAGGWYMGWASPNPENPLHGSIFYC